MFRVTLSPGHESLHSVGIGERTAGADGEPTLVGGGIGALHRFEDAG
jgi:hypothetical protein